jgi:ferredoxin-type protein NapG
MNRRNFVTATASLALGVLTARRMKPDVVRGRVSFGYGASNYLRPPGAVAEADFLAGCINCELCGQACPINCIQFFQHDAKGVRAHTPYIVASETACDLCLECTTSCPTGVLQPVASKKDVAMGIAVIEERLCLPYLRQGVCGACYTICPVNAVRLEKQRHPKVDTDRCVGCGLCEEVCLQEVKAIRIFPSEAAA